MEENSALTGQSVDEIKIQQPQPPFEPVEVKEEITPAQEAVAAPEQEIKEEVKESAQEMNFRKLREKAERVERERDEYLRRLSELQKPKQEPEQEEDFTINLGENDLAEGKHLSKIQKQLKRQQEALKKTQQKTEEMLIETRLKTEHPDIDRVVTAENLQKLAKEQPALAQTLNSSQDYYNKAKAAYTMIKKLGIQGDVFEQDRALAQKNAAKPRPLTSVSPQQAESPLSRANAFANGLTDELKVQLRKEMEEAAKNY